MNYSAYNDSDFTDLPEEEYKVILLLKRRVSRAVLAAAVSPESIRDVEYKKALEMITKKYPFISFDCVHGDTECCELYATTKYYLKVVLS
jgi:hypothetical protein